MPFVQMENISHFLSFISRPPVSLAAHDVFLTVDLFEQKDPAQVVQCLGAFSRVANKLDPISFPTTIGGLKVPGALTPQLSGGWSPGKRNASGGSTSPGGVANAYVQSAAAVGAPTPFGKPTVPPRKLGVSSWSKATDEKATAPAWNIAQYGYMGGASQGNQGVSFGARRQITNNPVVKGPSLEEKEKIRKNSADDAWRQQEEALDQRRMEDRRRQEEEDRLRQDRFRQMEEDRRRQQEEQQRRIEDEERRRAAHEAKLRREQEDEEARIALETERRKWKEEEERKRLWQHDQDRHRELERAREHEQKLATERREEEARRVRDAEAQRKLDAEKSERERERERIRQLERELEKARERERIYEAEKEERRRQDTERMRRDAQEAVVRKHRTGDSAYGTRASEQSTFSVRSHKTGDRESMEAERRFLAGGWRGDLATPPSPAKTNPLFPQHTPDTPPHPPRALPTPPPRKLPPAPTTPTRVGALPSSRYFTHDHLSSEPMHRSTSWETNDDGAAAEEREQEKKQAYKWARCVIVLIPDPPNPLIPTAQEVEEWITDRVRSMSLLERERERERERQREWEANQREMEERRGDAPGDTYDEHAWDINQYGYADDILDLY